MNNEEAPDNSFVSFTFEQTILVESKVVFSFNEKLVTEVSVAKEVSEPLGLVPLVDLTIYFYICNCSMCLVYFGKRCSKYREQFYSSTIRVCSCISITSIRTSSYT